jgi:propanediol dehydratase small subunit
MSSARDHGAAAERGPARRASDPAGGPLPRALSGRAIDEITLRAAVRGELAPADLRVHPDVLRHQAEVAEAHGNPQLGENLRRAAELTDLPDDEVLATYEALRPGRSTRDGLEVIASRLESVDAPLCAKLVREAAEVYARRGLLARA